MTTPLRVAVIGTGMIAAVHVRAARSAGAEVIGILGRDSDRSAESAAELSIEQAYKDLDELITDRPDVVHVCTPNDQHFPQAMAVIEAGINVVCEKPLAITAAEAEDLAAAAATAGVVATVPFVYRFHPMVREIRERISGGDLGRVLAVHGSYLQDWMLDPASSNWRIDAREGGPSRTFADIGSHWCDLVEFVTGERFTSVVSTTDIVHPRRPAPVGPSFSAAPPGTDKDVEVTTEDIAAATLRTKDGRLGNVIVSQISGGRKNRLWFEVDGSRSSAVFDQENPESAWFGTQTGATIAVRDPANGTNEQRRLAMVPAGHPQGYLDAFTAFVTDTYAAVRGGSPDGLPTFEDGARSARLVEAVLHSAQTRQWAEIPEQSASGRSQKPLLEVGYTAPTVHLTSAPHVFPVDDSISLR